MELTFKVQARIQKPRAEVFQAVYDPQKLAGYFITAGGSGPLDEGQTVTWEFADFPGPFPVIVKQMLRNEKIVFLWDAASPLKNGQPYKTTVEVTFEELSSSNTLVSISESGWEDSENGYKDSRGNLGGWMNMLTCMKAHWTGAVTSFHVMETAILGVMPQKRIDHNPSPSLPIWKKDGKLRRDFWVGKI